MSDEGRVMPSDMMQDVMPKQVTPVLGQRGSRHMAVMRWDRPRTQCLIRAVYQIGSRAWQQTCCGRGVCEQALKLHHNREGCRRRCHGRQPDSGNPTVRDDTGGLQKRELWWN